MRLSKEEQQRLSNKYGKTHTLGLPTLEYCRKRADVIQVYNLLHGKEDVNPDIFLMPNERTQTRGHSFKLKKERSNTSKRAAMFRHRVVNSWNTLPDTTVTAESVNAFKSNINCVWKTLHNRFD